jgi:hypothetical protein
VYQIQLHHSIRHMLYHSAPSVEPYSPGFGPIEEGFLAIKAWIRRNRDYARGSLMGEPICDPYRSLWGAVFATVTLGRSAPFSRPPDQLISDCKKRLNGTNWHPKKILPILTTPLTCAMPLPACHSWVCAPKNYRNTQSSTSKQSR